MTVIQLLKMFPDDATAEQWFEKQRWPKGRFCPDCGSTNIADVASRKPMPYRCRDCRGHFSVKKGTVMQSSKLGLQKWAIALYMMTTGIKGTSSMKIYRELGIRQATAWFLMQRIREGFLEGSEKPFPGPIEADETYVGGKRKNMSNGKRKELQGIGRGGVGKAAVVGVKDRKTGKVSARHVETTDALDVAGFVAEKTALGATVYTDEAKVYNILGHWYDHETVKHSVGEYVRGMAHTNGVESFWASLKRGYHGVYHRFSPKHLPRYVNEFAGRHNIRPLDTIDQMRSVAKGLEGKRLRFTDLTAPTGWSGVAG